MAKPLIGPGDIIVSAWETFRKQFRSYSQFVVWFAVLGVAQWAVYVLTRTLIFDKIYRTIVITVVSLPLDLLYAFLTVGVIELTARAMTNKKAPMNDVFMASLHKLIPFIWVAFLLWTVTMFGLILLVIPALVFFIWFKYGVNNMIIDDVHGFDALRESKRLVDGRWWGVLFRFLIPAIFWYVAAKFALQLIYLVAGATLGDPGLFFGNITSSDELSNSFLLITTVLPFIVNGYLLSLLTASDLALWYDLKRTA